MIPPRYAAGSARGVAVNAVENVLLDGQQRRIQLFGLGGVAAAQQAQHLGGAVEQRGDGQVAGDALQGMHPLDEIVHAARVEVVQ